MQSRKHYWMTLAAMGLSVSLHGLAQDTNRNDRSASDSTNATTPDASGRRGDSDSSRRQSWLPMTSYGYAGASVGVTSLNLPGCTPGVYCDDSGVGFKAYTGGMISRVIGVEVSYVQLLAVDRNGGDVRAKGVNLGLVANLPVTDHVNVFAKVGAIYGWTKTGSPIAGVATGDSNDLNWSYGAGAQVDLQGNWALRADWDVYRMKFASGATDASLYSVGLVYKF
jgi:OOP family OmpA-OmpF porin